MRVQIPIVPGVLAGERGGYSVIGATGVCNVGLGSIAYSSAIIDKADATERKFRYREA